MRTIFISFGMLLLTINQMIAQNQTVDSTKTERLEEVVITAQYVPQSEKNAIYRVKVLNAKTIDSKAANNLRELLQQELNLDLSQNSVFGSSIELQGISKENIKILIDGVPVIGRLNGVIDLNQINLSNIDRVELIEGPVSVFYGTDAMGGIINLITKKNQKDIVEGNVSAFYESISATNLDGNIGYKSGKNTYRVNGSYYYFDGLSTNDAPRNLNWEERSQYFVDLMYGRDFENLKLQYKSSFSNEKLASIGEPDRNGNIIDTEYFTRRIDNSINLQGKIFKNKFINITTSYLDYQRYHDAFNVDPNTLEKVLSTTDLKDDNIVKYNYGGLKMQLGKSDFSDKLNYAFGTDFNFESTEGERILDHKQSIETLAFFGSVNYKILDNFEIQPAARYTWNSSYGSLISPALNAKIRFNNQSQLRFSYSRGFRSPSLKELFLDFHISAGPFTYIISGNEDLEVEKSHSFNLQYKFNNVLNNSISIEPSLFYNDITSLIALSELVDFKRNYININKFKSVGGKIDFTYKPIKTLSLKTGFSLIGRYNKFTEEFDSEKFLYSPEISSGVNYQITKIKLNVDIFYKFSGKREGFYIDEDLSTLVKTTRNSFNNLNATVSKSFLKKNLKTSLGIKNAFNVKDIETINEAGQAHSRDLQLWGRSFFIKTTYNF